MSVTPSSLHGELAANTAAKADARAHQTAFLEYLPKWLICVPLVLQWIWLGLRYRSFMLPSLANPSITSGGLVGEGKSEYFLCMGATADAATAPWCRLVVKPERAMDEALECMRSTNLQFPIIAKPDIGWCGFGVRRVDDAAGLAAYLDAFPVGESLLLQAYVPHEGEAGIFMCVTPAHPAAASSGWPCGIFHRSAAMAAAVSRN